MPMFGPAVHFPLNPGGDVNRVAGSEDVRIRAGSAEGGILGGVPQRREGSSLVEGGHPGEVIARPDHMGGRPDIRGLSRFRHWWYQSLAVRDCSPEPGLMLVWPRPC